MGSQTLLRPSRSRLPVHAAKPVIEVPTDAHIIDATENEPVINVPQTESHLKGTGNKESISIPPTECDELSAGYSKQVRPAFPFRMFRRKIRKVTMPPLSSAITGSNRKKRKLILDGHRTVSLTADFDSAASCTTDVSHSASFISHLCISLLLFYRLGQLLRPSTIIQILEQECIVHIDRS